jgi:HrpA-like RNA helicase
MTKFRLMLTIIGSGKSTLMPLLLISSNTGIHRVAVTQPRRFAAVSIYETISHYHGHILPGFSMSGEHVNPFASILYITDGLLRTKLSLDHPMSMFDCIIIDEVHERSESIDTCIALLAKMKERRLKMPKIILSSATIDLRVLEPFKIAGCRIVEVKSIVKSPFSRTIHYPDAPCHKGCPICLHLSHTIYAPNVIKYVLSHQQKLWPRSWSKDDQLLVFMPSTQVSVDLI